MNLCGNGGQERPYGRKETGAAVCEDGRPILTYVAEDSKMSCNIIKVYALALLNSAVGSMISHRNERQNIKE